MDPTCFQKQISTTLVAIGGKLCIAFLSATNYDRMILIATGGKLNLHFCRRKNALTSTAIGIKTASRLSSKELQPHIDIVINSTSAPIGSGLFDVERDWW